MTPHPGVSLPGGAASRWHDKDAKDAVSVYVMAAPLDRPCQARVLELTTIRSGPLAIDTPLLHQSMCISGTAASVSCKRAVDATWTRHTDTVGHEGSGWPFRTPDSNTEALSP